MISALLPLMRLTSPLGHKQPMGSDHPTPAPTPVPDIEGITQGRAGAGSATSNAEVLNGVPIATRYDRFYFKQTRRGAEPLIGSAEPITNS